MSNNIDVEIYLNQLISFFEKNPNDLITLIGDSDKSVFYLKVKEQSLLNLKNGQGIELTQQQLIDVIVNLKLGDKSDTFNKSSIVNTKFGHLFLN